MYSAEGQAGPVLGTGAGNAGFGSVAEALRLGGAFADFLNSPAAALVDGAACGEALRALGEIQGKLSAAYAAFLRRFDAADGAHLSRIENGLRSPTGALALACDDAFPGRHGWFLDYYEESREWAEVPPQVPRRVRDRRQSHSPADVVTGHHPRAAADRGLPRRPAGHHARRRTGSARSGWMKPSSSSAAGGRYGLALAGGYGAPARRSAGVGPGVPGPSRGAFA